MELGDIPVPTLCRLEYLTRKGWVVGHEAINLLHPERYVERLEAHSKIGRCTELVDGFTPGQVWVSKVIPNPESIPASILERLVKTDVGNPDIPRLRAKDEEECSFCEGTICYGDGSCLL